MNFIKCQHVWKTYGGSLPKNAIMYHDALYMVKTPRTVFNHSLNQEKYINQIYAEHLSCLIIHALGYDVQETIIGTYGKNIAVACKDFTQEDFVLEDFIQVKNSVPACKYSGKNVDIDDILTAINHQTLIDVKILKEYFWDQFILDAFLGNVDRYNENWGILKNHVTNEVKLAPIYDCASSLDFDLSDYDIDLLLQSDAQLECYASSTHSVLTHHGKEINYASFISSHINPDCTKALLKFIKRVNFNTIHFLIDELPNVSMKRKQFYQAILQKRYHLIRKASMNIYRRKFHS